VDAKHLLLFGASVITASLSGPATAETTQEQYVQVAEIEIFPAQLDQYKAAVAEHIATALRVEPGVLVLYAVSDADHPTDVRVFEVYRDTDAYNSHLQSAHFLKYKTTTDKMVKSLKLVRVVPIMLGAKAK
jgi:quinol monooxygenase YgiN